MTPAGLVIPLTDESLGPLRERVRARQLLPSDYPLLEAILESVVSLAEALAQKDLSIRKLRRLLFGPSTEKTRDVIEGAKGGKEEASSEGPADRDRAVKPRGKRKGHGRNGIKAYPGAQRIGVPLVGVKAGESCPQCRKGTLYILRQPGQVPRVYGRPMLAVVVYELQKARCSACGAVFTAELPPQAGTEKFDATAGAMLATLKYGSGLPFSRIETLQDSLHAPLAASTQWEVVRAVAAKVQPVREELMRQAAQAAVIHNDDTDMTILSLEGSPAPNGDGGERRGVFTSAIVSEVEGHKVALFFTGQKHAGENLDEVLRRRDRGRAPPTQMCDGQSRNEPKEFQTIVSNCLAHARRRFIDVAPQFRGESRRLLNSLGRVYRNDAVAKERGLSAEERLRFHRAKSGPILKRLKTWLQALFDERRVEPNSGLGQAISYMLKRWDRLTRFLEKPGAPLDNNLCERVLKMAILHRKNSYFYRTKRGAWVGDILMTLIETCRLNGVNPFDYLTALQKHADRVRENPARWLPWNYQETVAGISGH